MDKQNMSKSSLHS